MKTYPSTPPAAHGRTDDDPLAFLLALAADGADVAPFQLGRRRAFLLNHPASVEEVLVRQPDTFVKGRAFDRAKRLLGEGLLTAGGSLHSDRRRLAEGVFRRPNLGPYAQAMVVRAARIRDRWEAQRPVDLAREMRDLTLTVAGDTLFGTDLSEAADDVARAVAVATPDVDGLVSIVASLRHARESRRHLDAVIDTIVERRMRSGESGSDLLALLLDACDPNDSAAVRQLKDDAVTFLLASHDTMAHALTWTWMLLARHPEARAALRAELREVLGEREPTAADLSKLVYTRSVFAESLRLFPPAWVIVREAIEASRIRGVEIPARALVVASPYVTHRDARLFSDPLSFNPARWIDQPTPARFAYFPFGAGLRSCIGEGFAWMEGTLAIATIASRWHLRLDADVEPVPRITLRPQSPVRMTPLYAGI